MTSWKKKIVLGGGAGLFVFSTTSCVSSRATPVADRAICGIWRVPGGQEVMAIGPTSDTIDHVGFQRETERDILKVGEAIDQLIQYRPNGSGSLQDANRGKLRFEYRFTCDESKPETQLVDSAGYYVEGSELLVPCTLVIGNTTYHLLKEQQHLLPDSVQLSRAYVLGNVLVQQSFFWMVRER